MMRDFLSLSGKWDALLPDGSKYSAILPGTLDTNQIGYEDKLKGKLHQDENYVENKALSAATVIATRFTRNHTYEGKAVFSRVLGKELPESKRFFLRAQRARVLELKIDGKKVSSLAGTLSTPYIFEVTDALKKDSVVELVSDNSYEGLPHDNIIYSSAATDETQTNWNGVIGELGIDIREKTFIKSVLVYPGRCRGQECGAAIDQAKDKTRWTFDVAIVIDSKDGFEGKLRFSFKELSLTREIDVNCRNGENCLRTRFEADVPGEFLWDEAQGMLIHLNAALVRGDGTLSGDLAAGQQGFDEHFIDTYETTFGIRSFEDMDGHFCLNGRRIFLRSETSCAVYPETGHPPMDVDSWKEIIKTYMGYGVNCLRFHSHCPPEAAFTAADELGMLMQPELSHWNPRDAFSDPLAAAYYEKELLEILTTYANHPSFVMLAFGNELQAREDGMAVADRLLDLCLKTDATRLFAFSSNPFYGEKGPDAGSDFYTASWFREKPMRATFAGMRGYLNNEYPDARHSYDNTVLAIRQEYKKPIFSFEVGQYEVLPDFKEIEDFHGVTSPKNLELIKENVEKKGLLDTWEKRVEATGELALLSYREEVEAARRTLDYSGISLLGLQDFPGQGTALVGMMNSHLKPKPYSFADPVRFKSFFGEALPLVYLEKYCYTDSEVLAATVRLSNYSKGDITERLKVSLFDGETSLFTKDNYPEITATQGQLTDIGEIRLYLSSINLKRNSALTLKVSFAGYENSYRIYVYTADSQKPGKPSGIYECRTMDAEAKEILNRGGCVFLAPDPTKESLPSSIKSTFTTDFWSVGTFSSQEGSMGLLIDSEHPLFKDYPTSFHADYQWFAQSSQLALILPEGIKSIVTVMDSYAYLRNMGMILEFNCEKGKVLVSTMGLHKLKKYPECRALLTSIYRYMDSEDFTPDQNISLEELARLVLVHGKELGSNGAKGVDNELS